MQGPRSPVDSPSLNPSNGAARGKSAARALCGLSWSRRSLRLQRDLQKIRSNYSDGVPELPSSNRNRVAEVTVKREFDSPAGLVYESVFDQSVPLLTIDHRRCLKQHRPGMITACVKTTISSKAATAAAAAATPIMGSSCRDGGVAEWINTSGEGASVRLSSRPKRPKEAVTGRKEQLRALQARTRGSLA